MKNLRNITSQSCVLLMLVLAPLLLMCQPTGDQQKAQNNAAISAIESEKPVKIFLLNNEGDPTSGPGSLHEAISQAVATSSLEPVSLRLGGGFSKPKVEVPVVKDVSAPKDVSPTRVEDSTPIGQKIDLPSRVDVPVRAEINPQVAPAAVKAASSADVAPPSLGSILKTNSDDVQLVNINKVAEIKVDDKATSLVATKVDGNPELSKHAGQDEFVSGDMRYTRKASAGEADVFEVSRLTKAAAIAPQVTKYPKAFHQPPLDILSKEIDTRFAQGDMILLRKMTSPEAELTHVLSQRIKEAEGTIPDLNEVTSYYTPTAVVRNGLNVPLYEKGEVGFIIDPKKAELRKFTPIDGGSPNMQTKRAAEEGTGRDDLIGGDADLDREIREEQLKAYFSHIPAGQRNLTDISPRFDWEEVDAMTKNMVKGTTPIPHQNGKPTYNEAFVHYKADDIMGIIQDGTSPSAIRAAKDLQAKMVSEYGLNLPIKVWRDGVLSDP